MNRKAYWMQMGSEGTKIATESARQPITAEKIAQAEVELEAIAARIRVAAEMQTVAGNLFIAAATLVTERGDK